MTATTTIRISRTTRDGLADIAHNRGVSVSQLLSEQVATWQRDEWFRQEREASQANDLTPAAREEQELWEETDDDWD